MLTGRLTSIIIIFCKYSTHSSIVPHLIRINTSSFGEVILDMIVWFCAIGLSTEVQIRVFFHFLVAQVNYCDGKDGPTYMKQNDNVDLLKCCNSIVLPENINTINANRAIGIVIIARVGKCVITGCRIRPIIEKLPTVTLIVD